MPSIYETVACMCCRTLATLSLPRQRTAILRLYVRLNVPSFKEPYSQNEHTKDYLFLQQL